MTKATKAETATGATPMEGTVAAGQEAFQSFLKAGSEGYERAFGATRERWEQAVKNYDQFAVTGKDNVDAATAASTAYTKGIEAINAELMAFGKQLMEDNVAAAKAILAAKTLQEMADLRSQFAKANFDGLMNQPTKIGEMATKLTQDTTEPLTHRLTEIMQQWTKIAA
jgi:phasin family protein